MDRFRYAIAAEKMHNKVPARCEVIHIPAATCAVFDAYGSVPSTHWNMIKQIYAKWFPSAGFQHAGTPDVEVYLPGGEGGNWPCHP